MLAVQVRSVGVGAYKGKRGEGLTFGQNLSKSEEFYRFTRILVWGEPEQAPNTRETGSNVHYHGLMTLVKSYPVVHTVIEPRYIDSKLV